MKHIYDVSKQNRMSMKMRRRHLNKKNRKQRVIIANDRFESTLLSHSKLVKYSQKLKMENICTIPSLKEANNPSLQHVTNAAIELIHA